MNNELYLQVLAVKACLIDNGFNLDAEYHYRKRFRGEVHRIRFECGIMYMSKLVGSQWVKIRNYTVTKEYNRLVKKGTIVC